LRSSEGVCRGYRGRQNEEQPRQRQHCFERNNAAASARATLLGSLSRRP
jgi:hypothetical protein